MALFPAYAQDVADIEIAEGAGRVSDSREVSPRREIQLLASDSGTDDERPARPALTRQPSHHEDFYWDTKSDYGNLRVSTLYYPGRPEYALSAKSWSRTGGRGGAFVSGGMSRRYYHAPVTDAPAHDELHARAAAYRRMLHDNPTDHALWLRYIDFQEQWFDGEMALRAAEEAVESVKCAGQGVGQSAGETAGARALKCELLRLRAAHLPRDTHLRLLRDELAAAQSGPEEESVRCWARVASALGAGGARAPALAAAALPRLAHLPTAYPHLLYIHGATLRAAGLWEQLVLMIELVAAMNFPPAGFPPPFDAERARAIEDDLQRAEDKVLCSGLPLSAMWVRVERARAAAHWRGERGEGSRNADPQRRPLPVDVADLLLPVADDDAAFLLCVNLLRLAKVPLMPQAEYVSRACGVSGLVEEEVGGAWGAADAECALPLVRAARRLPPAHPARPASPRLARALLAHFLDPPHYFTDDTGYLSWVSSLWEACCAWMSGSRRVALVCWRLRWLHALVLLLDVREEAGRREARRIRGEARAILKRHGGSDPLPFAQYARLEAALGETEETAPTGEAEEAGRRRAAASAAAERALRAALADADCDVTHRLYVARVLREVCGAAGGAGYAAWAVPCAVLGRALPQQHELRDRPAPTPAMLSAALQHCEERCSELEARFVCDSGGEAWLSARAALSPGAGEWAAARAALAPPHRLVQLLRDLPHHYDGATDSGSGVRYYEQSACALLMARDRHVASEVDALAHLFPHNALLAMANAGAPLWSRSRQRGAAAEARVCAVTQCARSHTAALALVLPALLRAAAADWTPRESERVRTTCVRASRRGYGGAFVAAVALEGAARGDRPGAAPRVLLPALDQHHDHKWLYVRGAAWVPSEADALADVLLERQLRVHALRDELALAPVAPQHDPQHEQQHDPQQEQQHDPQQEQHS